MFILNGIFYYVSGLRYLLNCTCIRETLVSLQFLMWHSCRTMGLYMLVFILYDPITIESLIEDHLVKNGPKNIPLYTQSGKWVTLKCISFKRRLSCVTGDQKLIVHAWIVLLLAPCTTDTEVTQQISIRRRRKRRQQRRIWRNPRRRPLTVVITAFVQCAASTVYSRSTISSACLAASF